MYTLVQPQITLLGTLTSYEHMPLYTYCIVYGGGRSAKQSEPLNLSARAVCLHPYQPTTCLSENKLYNSVQADLLQALTNK